MWIARGNDGQATVELVALLPVLAAIALLAWQAIVAGQAWWLAGDAAREAARSAALGGDPQAAAQRVLPAGLRRGLRVTRARTGDAGVAVRVEVPPVVAGLRFGSVTARARMEPQS